ncbi:MAG: gamma-glutamyl-gamma-aminobutyrate hydrolase family protein [Pseudomonadota bacterium]
MQNPYEILVVDPGLSLPETEAFNRMSKSSKIPLTYHLPNFTGCGSLFRTPPETIAGVVLFGSNASVHDHRPWQAELMSWLRSEIIDRKIPIFGICFGHQLLHLMLGGQVDYVHESKKLEIGKRTIQLQADPCLDIKNTKGEVFVYHSEQVTRVGSGFANWAKGDFIPHEASYHTEFPIWTIQSHPEGTAADCKEFQVDPNSFSNLFGWSIVDSFLDFCNLNMLDKSKFLKKREY